VIAAVGEHPRFRTAEFTTEIKQRLKNGLSDASSAVSRGHTDFIDPQLGRGLVGVNVVNGRRKTDYPAAIHRYDEVMSRIGQELPCRTRVESIIEHVASHGREQSFVVSMQHLDHHWAHHLRKSLTAQV
jgi:hypothetical protein